MTVLTGVNVASLKTQRIIGQACGGRVLDVNLPDDRADLDQGARVQRRPLGGDGVFKARENDRRRQASSVGCGLEALEGRQFLSATYVAKQPAPLRAVTTASVKPLVKAPAPESVKRAVGTNVIQLDGGIDGDYQGDLTFPNDTFKRFDLTLAPGNGGRYAGTVSITTFDPQTEAQVGPPVVFKVQFIVNAAGDFRVLQVVRNQITVMRGRFVDGTMQGQFQQYNRGGMVKADIFAYQNSRLG